MSKTDYDVIVVGYGPVGETCANLLGYYGIKSLIIDKDQGVFPLPRAITWDAECERAISVCNFSEKVDVRPIRGADHIDANKNSFLKVALIEYAIYKYSHYVAFMYQPQYDRVHRENANKYKTNTIKEGWELIDYKQEKGYISCKIKDVNSNTIQNTTAKFLLGTDGATSTVRKISNIELQDYNSDETWMVVDGYTDEQFECFEEVDAIQFCNPERPITIIQGVKNRFRFEIAFMPDDKVEEIQKEEVFSNYINYWIKDRNVVFDRKAVYSFHAASAKKWRNGNVFLLGDAAHQMPPFMGQGMNSGCRDAENLLWKMNGVLKGIYKEGILDTYQSERKPHADKIMRAAITMGGIINAKSQLKAFLRNIFVKLQTLFKGKDDFFPANFGIPLGEGVHKTPFLKKASIERYYFNNTNVRLKDGRIKNTDQLLEKNFGIIIKNFDNKKIISDNNLEILQNLNFKIINFTKSYEDANYANYIPCEEISNDFNTFCEKYNCNGVILRPDKYVFDVINFDSSQDLNTIVSSILSSLQEKIAIN